MFRLCPTIHILIFDPVAKRNTRYNRVDNFGVLCVPKETCSDYFIFILFDIKFLSSGPDPGCWNP